MATTTTDLISASRALDPPDRALLNLWLRRGLDDVAIARLSGGAPEEVAVRRDRLVLALAQEVEVSPEEIRASLAELSGQGARPAERVPEPGAVEPVRSSSRAVVLGDAQPVAAPAAPALVLPGEAGAPPGEAAELIVAGAPPDEAPEVVVPPAAAAGRPARVGTPAPEPAPSGFDLPDTLAVTLALVLVLLLVLAVLAG